MCSVSPPHPVYCPNSVHSVTKPPVFSLLKFYSVSCRKFSSLSVTKNNLLFLSSLVSFSSAQFHTFCNTSKFPTYAALCQAALPSLSVANNNLLFSFSFVSFFSAESHTFSKVSNFPLHAAQCQAVPYCLWLIPIYYLCPLLLVFLEPTPILSAVYLGSPLLQTHARRSFPHCLWQISVYYLCPLLLISIQPIPILAALYQGSLHVLHSAKRSFPHCLWLIRV